MKCFTRLFPVLFIAFFTLPSCVNLYKAKGVEGNGTIVSKELSISDYTEIYSGMGSNVIYEQVSEESPYLQINVDENILPLLDIQVEDGRLIIKTKNDANIHPSKFVIFTNSKNLNKVNLSGSGEIHLKGEVNSKDMQLNISGSGNLVSDSLYCERLGVDISGAGNASLAGASNSSSFTVSGAGDVKALNYFVQDLVCRISGAGNMEVAAGGKLNATISGAGNIQYKGNPQTVNKNISGSGTISRID